MKHVQLVPQQRDLGSQLRLRPKGRSQRVQEQRQESGEWRCAPLPADQVELIEAFVRAAPRGPR